MIECEIVELESQTTAAVRGEVPMDELDSGLEMFGDFYWYDSSTNRLNAPAVDLAAVPLRVREPRPVDVVDPEELAGR